MQSNRNWKDLFQGFFDNSVKQHAARKRAEKLKRRPSQTFILEGNLQPGDETQYSIGGEDIVLDESTWIFGDLHMGSRVAVTGIIGTTNEKQAKKIVIR